MCGCVCGVRFSQDINQNSGMKRKKVEMEKLKMEKSVALKIGKPCTRVRARACVCVCARVRVSLVGGGKE